MYPSLSVSRLLNRLIRSSLLGLKSRYEKAVSIRVIKSWLPNSRSWHLMNLLLSWSLCRIVSPQYFSIMKVSNSSVVRTPSQSESYSRKLWMTWSIYDCTPPNIYMRTFLIKIMSNCRELPPYLFKMTNVWFRMRVLIVSSGYSSRTPLLAEWSGLVMGVDEREGFLLRAFLVHSGR